jgi:hypothetical protein
MSMGSWTGDALDPPWTGAGERRWAHRSSRSGLLRLMGAHRELRKRERSNGGVLTMGESGRCIEGVRPVAVSRGGGRSSAVGAR